MSQNTMEGILLVDKPRGITSYDVVDSIKKRFHIRKVGHSGTLDPLATGLLILLLGRYTKAAAKFIGLDKDYEAILRFGVTTDTADAVGRVISEQTPGEYSIEYLKQVVGGFAGETAQVPPMYSAKSIGGKRLYHLARKGLVVEREPVKIRIHNIIVKAYNPPDLSLNISCSSGTYIRTLCEDIGKQVGCGAHLLQLRRTKVGEYSVRNSLGLDELLRLKHEDLLRHLIHPRESAYNLRESASKQ